MLIPFVATVGTQWQRYRPLYSIIKSTFSRRYHIFLYFDNADDNTSLLTYTWFTKQPHKRAPQTFVSIMRRNAVAVATSSYEFTANQS